MALTADDRARGGQSTLFTHGMVQCPTCGSFLPSNHFNDIGSKGGKAVKAKYGNRHFSDIGKLGGRGNTREKRCQKND